MCNLKLYVNKSIRKKRQNQIAYMCNKIDFFCFVFFFSRFKFYATSLNFDYSFFINYNYLIFLNIQKINSKNIIYSILYTVYYKLYIQYYKTAKKGHSDFF